MYNMFVCPTQSAEAYLVFNGRKIKEAGKEN